MIQKALIQFRQDSLFQNSVYLLLSTILAAASGFFFWLVAARLFSPSDVGLATTLIAAMNIIQIFSLVGINNAFIRFLPKSETASRHITTGIIVAGGFAALLATVFLALIPFIAPKLQFVQDNIWLSFGFLALAITASLNFLTDSIFIAYREAKYNFWVGIALAASKVVLPFAVIAFGAYGLFGAAAGALAVALALSLFFMARVLQYRPKAEFDRAYVRQAATYSLGNYVAGALNFVPSAVLPLLIAQFLSSAAAAYFYIAMMIANLLYAIPMTVTQSLFAEGSHNETGLHTHVKKAARLLALGLVPSILLLVISAPFLLALFGKTYADNGALFLQLLAIAAVPIGINYVFTAMYRVKKLVAPLIMVNTFIAIASVGLSFMLLPYGLIGVGIGWILGNSAGSLLFVLLQFVRRGR